MNTHEEAVSSLLQDWKKKPDLLITLEMLKSSLKPLVDNQMSKYEFRKIGVREIDVRDAADKLLVEALHTYDESKGSLSTWIVVTLKELDRTVEELQNKFGTLRKA